MSQETVNFWQNRLLTSVEFSGNIYFGVPKMNPRYVCRKKNWKIIIVRKNARNRKVQNFKILEWTEFFRKSLKIKKKLFFIVFELEWLL
jgi:hypothetical protein